LEELSGKTPVLSLHLDSLEEFHAAVAANDRARVNRSTWQALEPAAYHFLLRHKADFNQRTAETQRKLLKTLVEFLSQRREQLGEMTVIGPGRPIVALLANERATQREHVEKLAATFATTARTFRSDESNGTSEAMGGFLDAVTEAASRGKPVTVVMLGHGLPDVFAVRPNATVHYGTVAAALVQGAAARVEGSIDLSCVCLVMDACFSADFVINLAMAIEQQAASRGAPLASLPVFVSSSNRDRLAFGIEGSRNYCAFWHEIAAFHVDEKVYRNRTLERITFGNLLNEVDRRMFGRGRSPIIAGKKVIGWRIVQPDAVQDPAFFIPLKQEDLDELRQLLGLPEHVELPRLLEIG
jgi:hypothetical protein